MRTKLESFHTRSKKIEKEMKDVVMRHGSCFWLMDESKTL